jgi:NitT/TauT family transport system substrate-binding protein
MPSSISVALSNSWVAVRTDEIERRRPEMVALTKSLTDALKALHGMSGEQMVAALPKEMTTGLDLGELATILQQHRDALYPDGVGIDLDAANRVEKALVAGGLVKADTNISGLHDTTIAGG